MSITKTELYLTRLFYTLGVNVISFTATAFLASMWAGVGFNLWKTLPWRAAIGMWALYLTPVVLGYYVGRVVERMEKDVHIRVMCHIGSGKTVTEIHKLQDELFWKIANLTGRYKRVGIWGILFVLFVVIDIVVTIVLHAKKLV